MCLLSILLVLTLTCLVQAHDEGLSDTTCLPLRSSFSRLQEYNQAKSLLLGNFTCLAHRLSFSEQGVLTDARRYFLQTYYDKSKGAIVSQGRTLYSSPVNEFYMEEYVTSTGEVCILEGDSLSGFFSESFDLHKGAPGYTSRLLQSYDKHVERLVRRVEYVLPTQYGQLVVFTLLDKKQRPLVQEISTCTRE
jgi:hypothetical protein